MFHADRTEVHPVGYFGYTNSETTPEAVSQFAYLLMEANAFVEEVKNPLKEKLNIGIKGAIAGIDQAYKATRFVSRVITNDPGLFGVLLLTSTVVGGAITVGYAIANRPFPVDSGSGITKAGDLDYGPEITFLSPEEYVATAKAQLSISNPGDPSFRENMFKEGNVLLQDDDFKGGFIRMEANHLLNGRPYPSLERFGRDVFIPAIKEGQSLDCLGMQAYIDRFGDIMAFCLTDPRGPSLKMQDGTVTVSPKYYHVGTNFNDKKGIKNYTNSNRVSEYLASKRSAMVQNSGLDK